MCNAFGYYWADLCMVKIRTQLHRQKRNQKHIKYDENNKSNFRIATSYRYYYAGGRYRMQ